MEPTADELFIEAFSDMSTEIHEWAKGKGFWDNTRNQGEMIALMHSELSECLEAIRKPAREMDEHCPDFLSESIELADCVIRIMDYSAAYGLNVGEAIVAKMQYNATRPHKHGKKF